MDEIRVGVLTVSDRCDRKEAVDESGPNLVKMIEGGIVGKGFVAKTCLVSDDREDIERVLREWSDDGVHLILTTGGTGLSERDVTPEATAAVLEKSVSGISQLIFKRSSEVTPLAALSRGIAGVRRKSLIINLPGSKKAAGECLEAVAGVIPHAVHIINGRKEDVERVHASLGEWKSTVVAGNVAARNRVSPYECIFVSEAQAIVTERIFSMKRQKVIWYEEALGHVLAQDAVALDDLPPFDASIKDGYAVVSSDGTGRKKVIGVAHAGASLLDVRVSPGHCVRISTGAPMPPGADAVVQVEDTSRVGDAEGEEKEVLVRCSVSPGTDVRKRGSDFSSGERLLRSGTYLDSAGVGLLAAAGLTCVTVYEKPLVAIISTGDELVNPEENLKPGKVRDTNRITLRSLLKEEGFQAVDLGIAADEPDALRNALERGFRSADVVVTTGSMSMGERDYLKEVLVCDFNAEICFGRVLVKPGKPTSFAILAFEGKPKLWFGLPGNPASALVTSHLFLLPALRRISGLEKVLPKKVHVQRQDLVGHVCCEDRPQYLRAILTYDDKKWKAEVIGDQRSSRIGSCANANCLVEIPTRAVSSDSLLNAFLIGRI